MGSNDIFDPLYGGTIISGSSTDKAEKAWEAALLLGFEVKFYKSDDELLRSLFTFIENPDLRESVFILQ